MSWKEGCGPRRRERWPGGPPPRPGFGAPVLPWVAPKVAESGPGGDAGAGDQLLDGQLAGILVREALALFDVPGQGGPDAGAGAGDVGV